MLTPAKIRLFGNLIFNYPWFQPYCMNHFISLTSFVSYFHLSFDILKETDLFFSTLIELPKLHFFLQLWLDFPKCTILRFQKVIVAFCTIFLEWFHLCHWKQLPLKDCWDFFMLISFTNLVCILLWYQVLFWRWI